MTDIDAERKALCTRASEQEAKRQAAQARRDTEAERAAEDELRRLWARFAALEDRAA